MLPAAACAALPASEIVTLAASVDFCCEASAFYASAAAWANLSTGGGGGGGGTLEDPLIEVIQIPPYTKDPFPKPAIPAHLPLEGHCRQERDPQQPTSE